MPDWFDVETQLTCDGAATGEAIGAAIRAEVLDGPLIGLGKSTIAGRYRTLVDGPDFEAYGGRPRDPPLHFGSLATGPKYHGNSYVSPIGIC